MSDYVRSDTTEPFHFEGWVGNRKWWVMSRNGRTVATCQSRPMAKRITLLLNADEAAKNASSSPQQEDS